MDHLRGAKDSRDIYFPPIKWDFVRALICQPLETIAQTYRSNRIPVKTGPK